MLRTGLNRACSTLGRRGVSLSPLGRDRDAWAGCTGPSSEAVQAIQTREVCVPSRASKDQGIERKLAVELVQKRALRTKKVELRSNPLAASWPGRCGYRVSEVGTLVVPFCTVLHHVRHQPMLTIHHLDIKPYPPNCERSVM